MEYDAVDIVKSKANISRMIENTNEYKLFLESNYLTNIDKTIWNSKSKITFQNYLEVLNKKVCNVLNKLNNAQTTIDEIQKIQEKNRLIKIIEEEIQILQNSTLPTDKLKLSQKMTEVENLKMEVKTLDTKIINDWSN